MKKWVIITVSLFIVTGIIWSFTPYFVPRKYILLCGMVPMTLSIPMALALSLYKNKLKFEIKDKKLRLTLDDSK